MSDFDTAFGYGGGKWAFFSSTETKWINLIRQYAKDCPDDVQIIKDADEEDRSIYCRIKPDYLKLTPKRKRHVSEERLAQLKEQGRKLAESRKRKGE